MDETEISALLQRVTENESKLAALLERPKKDKWDKFASISSFTSSVLLAGLGLWFTYHTTNVTNAAKMAQDDTDRKQKAAQDDRDSKQKEQQNKISDEQVLVQAMPYLLASDNNQEKPRHALSLLATIPGQSVFTKLVLENPTTENVKAYNALRQTGESKSSKLPPKPDIIKPVTSTGIDSGETILFDGFKNFKISAFRFADKKIVEWGADFADIEVANPDSTGSSPAVFFLETDLPPYTGPTLQAGRVPASAGIIEMTGKTYEQITEAPRSGYQYHYFSPKKGAAYCVRTFDGKHYAKILVREITPDRIAFEWQYQPIAGNNSFL